MGYIHCCGGLRKSRTFRLVPKEKFVVSELDYLESCPVCGHTVIQLTRIDENNELSIVRKINAKALNFYNKLKDKIIYEIKPENVPMSKGRFYLYYNEYGVRKKCFSNLSTLKIGRWENKNLCKP